MADENDTPGTVTLQSALRVSAGGGCGRIMRSGYSLFTTRWCSVRKTSASILACYDITSRYPSHSWAALLGPRGPYNQGLLVRTLSLVYNFVVEPGTAAAPIRTSDCRRSRRPNDGLSRMRP